MAKAGREVLGDMSSTTTIDSWVEDLVELSRELILSQRNKLVLRLWKMRKQDVDGNVMRIRDPAEQEMMHISQQGRSGPRYLLNILTRDKHRSFEVDVVGHVLSRLWTLSRTSTLWFRGFKVMGTASVPLTTFPIASVISSKHTVNIYASYETELLNTRTGWMLSIENLMAWPTACDRLKINSCALIGECPI